MNKPVVTFNNIAPGENLLNITDTEDLEPMLQHAYSKPAELMCAIKSYGQRVHPYTDGLLSQRTLDAIDAAVINRAQLARRKLDIARQFKMRKKLSYWRF